MLEQYLINHCAPHFGVAENRQSVQLHCGEPNSIANGRFPLAGTAGAKRC